MRSRSKTGPSAVRVTPCQQNQLTVVGIGDSPRGRTARGFQYCRRGHVDESRILGDARSLVQFDEIVQMLCVAPGRSCSEMSRSARSSIQASLGGQMHVLDDRSFEMGQIRVNAIESQPLPARRSGPIAWSANWR